MKLARLLQSELKALGVERLYGIPGDFVLPLFEDIQAAGELPLLYLSHEPSAVFAADAEARLTNRPSAVLLTYGAGALNGVNAVAQAYVEHVPLIVIAGFPSQAEIERGLLIHHQARAVDSQRNIYREITCTQVRLDDPATAAAELRRALRACAEKSLPVLIEFPRDGVNFDVIPEPAFQAPDIDRAQLHEACGALWARLKAARRPVILSGVDVRRFGAVDALQDFAARARIPLLSTLMGRACLDAAHPMYGGIFLDKSDAQPARLLAEADLILFAGVIKNDSNFAAHADLFPASKVMDLQQGAMAWDGVQYEGLALPAVFAALADSVDYQFDCGPLSHVEPVSAESPAQRLTATLVVSELHRALSQQAGTVPIVSDVGDCLFASLQANPKYLLAPAFYASMGYAVPAVFGVQAATGLRPVVLVGDGAFQMTGLELGHCARYGFAPIVILFNNQRWDMIRAFAPGLACTDLGNWNYQQLAGALGGQGYVANTVSELQEALAQAQANAQQFSLIDARLCPNSRTARLDRFATGFLSANQKATVSCTS